METAQSVPVTICIPVTSCFTAFFLSSFARFKCLSIISRFFFIFSQLSSGTTESTRLQSLSLSLCLSVSLFLSLSLSCSLSLYIYISYLPTEQDMTRGQFLSGVWQVWIQSFPSPRLVASPRLKNLVCHTIYP